MTNNNSKDLGVNVREAKAAVDAGAFLLDVRETNEFEAGHATGAVSIPLSELNDRYTELDKDAEIYCICKSGGRSGQAAGALSEAGYNVTNVIGGSLDWYGEGLPFVSENGSEPTVL
jgi:rhodanese-related sulfurtransferase